MAADSRLGKQIEEITSTLNSIGVRAALIGGLALAAHKVIRATQDVDLLVDTSVADQIDEAVTQLGYHCLHRSGNAANYARGPERLDFLFAGRPIARRLLADAVQRTTEYGALCVVSGEGLIGFKLQAVVNDPRRTQDLEDIRALLRANRASLDMNEVREYFRLFEREALLAELLNE
jgi:predicted nucleotidyltransferase